MRKRIILATSALVLSAGSMFALNNQGEQKTVEKAAREHCAPECCNGNENTCNPEECSY